MVPSNIAVVPLTSPEELDGLLAVEGASFTNPWTREMYLAELDNHGVSYFFLAKEETGRIIGFCSFWRVIDELHLNNLAVLPEYRRRGVASAILTRILGEARHLGANRVTLEVRRSNVAAQRLYETFGFAVAGVRRRYYSQPEEDALVLWRDGSDRTDLETSKGVC